MKRLLLVILLGTVLMSGTGCCIIDRLFHCPCGRWRGGGCAPGCDSCDTCAGCADPQCGYGYGKGASYGYGGAPAYGDGEVIMEGEPMAYGPPPGMGPHGCRDCKLGKCLLHGGAGSGYAGPQGPPGPPTGQVAYPYYTTRGPRDFLASNPPDIGP